jgi:hypothetical protein
VDRSREPIRLTLEIDPEAEPLSGQIERVGRPDRREFVGWTGLAAALTMLLEVPEEPGQRDAPPA